MDSTPVVLTMPKSAASVPDLVHVTVPRWPVTVGAGPVQAAFSATVAFESPPMVSVSVTSPRPTLLGVESPLALKAMT